MIKFRVSNAVVLFKKRWPLPLKVVIKIFPLNFESLHPP